MMSSAEIPVTTNPQCSVSRDHVTTEAPLTVIQAPAKASEGAIRPFSETCISSFCQNPTVILPLCMGIKCALKLWLSSVTQNLPRQVCQSLCRLYPLRFSSLIFRTPNTGCRLFGLGRLRRPLRFCRRLPPRYHSHAHAVHRYINLTYNPSRMVPTLCDERALRTRFPWCDDPPPLSPASSPSARRYLGRPVLDKHPLGGDHVE